MRGAILSSMMVLLLSFVMYLAYFGSFGRSGHGKPAQATTTGVEMDLTSLAEAERIYLLQNGSYGSLDQVMASGAMDKLRTNRDGYEYSIETTSSGFTVTAKHEDAPGESASSHSPSMSIDEKMQLRHEDGSIDKATN